MTRKKQARKHPRSKQSSNKSVNPVLEEGCPHFCAACPYVNYSYSRQLHLKKENIERAFLEKNFTISFLEKIMKDVRPSPVKVGYRNKAKWRIAKKNRGELVLGVYKPGTHDVVDITECKAHAKEINSISLAIKKLLEKHKVPCDFPDLNKASLRYLIVRYSFLQKKFLVVFVTSKAKIYGLSEVVFSLKRKYGTKLTSIVQNINDSESDVLLGGANRFLMKKEELVEKLGSYKVPVGPLSFVQVNTSQASYLYKRVKQILGTEANRLGVDLYSGVGLFAMHLHKNTDSIVAVEENGSSVLEAASALRQNKIHNVLPMCSDAVEGLEKIYDEFGSADWVVLNPPRRGCSKSVLQQLANDAPGKIVYVSCNPKSLARDIRFLLDNNASFQLKLIEPVDMFPLTEHVECIALLVNKTYSKDSKQTLPTIVSSPMPKKSRILH